MADLSNLARQAAGKPEFIAHRLSAYQQETHLDDVALASQLGCSLDDLTHLRLCAIPRPGHLQDDITRIATHVHVNADERGVDPSELSLNEPACRDPRAASLSLGWITFSVILVGQRALRCSHSLQGTNGPIHRSSP